MDQFQLHPCEKSRARDVVHIKDAYVIEYVFQMLPRGRWLYIK